MTVILSASKNFELMGVSEICSDGENLLVDGVIRGHADSRYCQAGGSAQGDRDDRHQDLAGCGHDAVPEIALNVMGW